MTASLKSIKSRSCRCCLLEDHKKLRPLIRKTDDEGETPIKDMLKNLIGNALNIDNEIELADLPKYICRACEISLNLTQEFKERVMATQQVIYEYCERMGMAYNGASCKSIEWTNNGNPESEIELTRNNIAFDHERMELPQHDIEVTQDDIELTQNKSGLSQNSLRVIKNENAEEGSGQDTDGLNDFLVEREGLVECIEPTEESEHFEEYVEISDICLAQVVVDQTPDNFTDKKMYKISFDKKEKPEKFKAKRLHTKHKTKEPSSNAHATRPSSKQPESKHICDICGNVFQKRGRLTEHRKRHSASCYECELCGKPFNLREPFRRHMLLHSNVGRPFKCSKCTRTFFYESVLRAHEAIHAGVKPYVCDVCNRAFAYDQALKKHKLIHANIKQYHCKLCDKDFRLQHHLQRHEESKVHLMALQSLKGDEN